MRGETARGESVVDDLISVLLGTAALLLLLATPILAVAALGRARRLDARLVALEARLARIEAAPATHGGRASVAEPQAEPVAAPAPEPSLPTPPLPALPRGHLETRLAERWLVWLGGVALALGGLFLASWAMEQGWLGPQVRLGGAALLGIALIALGERARGKEPAAEGARPDYVPAALVGGGLSALYGSALAAHLLYALVGPAMAFGLLALVSLLGVGLGLRFGPVVALLGAVGAYLAPALVSTQEPSAWALFLFLGALAPSLLVPAWLGGWPWLAWLDLAGAVFWQLAWLVTGPIEAAPAAPACHLLLLAAGALTLLARGGPALAAPRLARPLQAMVAAAAGLHLPLLLATDHAPPALASLALLSGATLLVALRREPQRWLAAIAAAADLLAALVWDIPAPDGPTTHLRDPSVGLEPLFWVAPQAAPLAMGLAAIAAAYSLLGLAAAWRRLRPGFWAGLSAAVPLLALVVAYIRLAALELSPGWAVLALGLAALSLAAAERAARRPGLAPALAAYAVGTVGGIALACTMALEDAWLTMALAVLLPAMAWIGRRLALPELRGPAWALAAVVLVRLLLDVDLLLDPGAAWRPARLLYAYGVPLVAFALAARWFGEGRPADPLAAALNGGALIFWLLLVTQEIRGAAGLSGVPPLGLAEASALGLAWLGTGLLLLRWQRLDPAAIVPRLGWPVLAAVAAALFLGHNLLLANPVLTGDPVGAWPALNLLLPAYGLPALLAALAGRELARQGRQRLAGGTLIVSQALGLVWATLEVRHAFQGSVLTGPTGDAEWLAWSGAWLAYAGALLGLGIARSDRASRATALVVASLAIAKTFLFDLGELTGLYRAVSFLALGLCLVGVGWLYRRFVAA
jgi:uncharacterized membrane protein